MATRSLIGIRNPNGTITYVYCHWDGYPDGVGKTLKESYTDLADVDQLLEGGDMSTLGATPAQCEFYRSRGEKDVDSRSCAGTQALVTAASRCGAQYAYVFDGEKWETHLV